MVTKKTVKKKASTGDKEIIEHLANELAHLKAKIESDRSDFNRQMDEFGSYMESVIKESIDINNKINVGAFESMLKEVTNNIDFKKVWDNSFKKK